jgi:hypothetical protein
MVRAIGLLVAVFVAGQPLGEAPSIAARVVDPDGKPVTTGTVALMTTPTARVTAAINANGEFRIHADVPGRHAMWISVPDLAPYRAIVSVPASRSMALPDIQLQQATYLRARFVSAEGEPLGGSMRRRSLDADGGLIADPLDHVRQRFENDGTVMLGPLPLGRTLLAFDRTGWAQTRLRDAIVNGTQPLIDAGTVVIGLGGTIVADVVDAAGAPAAQHNVWIEDAVQPSPLVLTPMKTNDRGRAEFTRIAAGRYRVWTQTVERCGVQPLSVSRLVSASGSGATHIRLVIDGRARLRIMSALGPLVGKSIAASPDAPAQTPWQPQVSNPMMLRLRLSMPRSPVGCAGLTDAEGKVTLSPFPPGAADVRVPLINSTYLTRVTVPASGAEITIDIPDGLVPVKVIDRDTRAPIGSALALWTGSGSRVEAITNANGDALIEATGASGGTLRFTASGYETLEGNFPETPDTLQEVAMTRLPPDLIEMHVATADATPIADATVVLSSSRVGDADEMATTDAAGIVRFTNLPPGPLRAAVSAAGFMPQQQLIPASRRSSVPLVLAPAPRF